MSLFCQNCGLEQSSYADVCPGCGRRWSPAPGVPSPNIILPQPSDDLYGVGGWLLLFCLSLTFAVPIRHALIAEKALRNLASARVPIQILLRLGSLGAIYAALAVFSFTAGLMLWMEKPKALKVARAYLVIGAVLPIALSLLLQLSGMRMRLFPIVFDRLAYSVLWCSYLQKSHRVLVTYGKP